MQLYIAVQAVYHAYLGKLLEREVFGVFKAVSTSACALAPSLVQMIRLATSPTEKFHALGVYLPYGIRFLRGLRFEVTYSGHRVPPVLQFLAYRKLVVITPKYEAHNVVIKSTAEAFCT